MDPRESAPAADGYKLSVTRFAAHEPAWATLCLGGAMGVRQGFYAPFARYLAGHGIHVLTFDYRGSGGSRPPRLAGFETSVTQWAELDLDAMLAEARKPAPRLPLLFVGHSLGGQILGIAPGNASVRAAVHVTTGSGYYRYNDRMPILVRLLWFVVMPLLVTLFGYFPGKRLRIVGDLPAGVAWQWRRWCLHPDYVLSEGGGVHASFARVTAPILSISFADDVMVTRAAIESLEGFYPNARVERRHVAPADIGEKRIGHFGFFSEASRATLWKDALDWLRAQVKSTATNATGRTLQWTP